MGLKKAIIQGAVLSLALAFYSALFQPQYEAWLKSMGRSIGIGETALGYFIVFCISYFVTHILTRKLEVE